MTQTGCTKKNRDIPTNLRKLVKDTHCLFGAVGEILHMDPGTVMKEAKAQMISRPSDEGYYVSETEIATRVTRCTEFENVKHNKRGPDIHETD
jgi:hypothetical protein